jgi:hypothetical protein
VGPSHGTSTLKIELGLEALTRGIDGGKIGTVTPYRATLDVDLLWKDYKILSVVEAGPFDLLRHVRLGKGMSIL